MKIVEKIRNAYKFKKMTEQKNALSSEFKVVERQGNLWLTHCGVAFLQLDNNTTSEQISKLLKEARTTAITFAVLEP